MKTLITALALVTSVSLSHANTLNGVLWHVPEAVAQNAVPSSVPGTTPDVTFSVTAPMNFSCTSCTVGAWLASSGAFSVVQNTPGTLTSLLDNLSVGTLVEFLGNATVFTGQTFTATHDDGLTLIIGGTTVISAPGPTSPTLTTVTYGGPSGNFPLQLVYGECCSGPAVLQMDIPFQPVPGPIAGAGIPGLIAGCLGLVALARRRKSAIGT
jgi:hypothetical protein